jgi:hypothetical protein
MARLQADLRAHDYEVVRNETLTTSGQYKDQQEVGAARSVLVIMSGDASDARWVTRALSEARAAGQPLICVRTDPLAATPAALDPTDLTWLDFATVPYDEGLAALLQALASAVTSVPSFGDDAPLRGGAGALQITGMGDPSLDAPPAPYTAGAHVATATLVKTANQDRERQRTTTTLPPDARPSGGPARRVAVPRLAATYALTGLVCGVNLGLLFLFLLPSLTGDRPNMYSMTLHTWLLQMLAAASVAASALMGASASIGAIRGATRAVTSMPPIRGFSFNPGVVLAAIAGAMMVTTLAVAHYVSLNHIAAYTYRSVSAPQLVCAYSDLGVQVFPGRWYLLAYCLAGILCVCTAQAAFAARFGAIWRPRAMGIVICGIDGAIVGAFVNNLIAIRAATLASTLGVNNGCVDAPVGNVFASVIAGGLAGLAFGVAMALLFRLLSSTVRGARGGRTETA